MLKRRGSKPQGKVSIKWSPKFAYAVGLLTSDGCLYSDRRHISFTSKDLVLAKEFKKALGLNVKIGKKRRKSKLDSESEYYHVQFGDVLFYNFLLTIGLTPAKSKTIGTVVVPDGYFFDFLRGCFDGDGTFYSYWDKRWKSSHMFYLEFISASKKHIDWLQLSLKSKLEVRGHISSDSKKSTYQLKFAKKEALVIIGAMYYNRKVVCLPRKRLKIEKAVAVEKEQQALY